MRVIVDPITLTGVRDGARRLARRIVGGKRGRGLAVLARGHKEQMRVKPLPAVADHQQVVWQTSFGQPHGLTGPTAVPLVPQMLEQNFVIASPWLKSQS